MKVQLSVNSDEQWYHGTTDVASVDQIKKNSVLAINSVPVRYPERYLIYAKVLIGPP